MWTPPSPKLYSTCSRLSRWSTADWLQRITTTSNLCTSDWLTSCKRTYKLNRYRIIYSNRLSSVLLNVDSSMSRSYIGPFGRIIPLEDGATPPVDKAITGLDGRTATMSAYQLPRPMPSKLQFGTDTTLGFTDPLKYKTMNSRKPGDPVLGQGDSLPSINSMFKHDHSPNASSPLPPSNYDSPRRLPSGSPRRDILQEHHSYNARQHADPHPQPTQHVPSSHDVLYDSRYSRPNIAPYQNNPYRHLEAETNLPAGPPDNARAAYQTPMTTPLSTSYPRYHDSNDYSTASPASLPTQNSQEFSRPPKPVKKPIREEHVPGEGMCYIYDDGSYVRKVIDGESVNAQWGVTKAGKPRKRLAVACLICREKKIKCEPGVDKCTQCQKSGRECIYHQA